MNIQNSSFNNPNNISDDLEQPIISHQPNSSNQNIARAVNYVQKRIFYNILRIILQLDKI